MPEDPDGRLATWPSPRPQGDYTVAVVHGDVACSAGMTPRVDGQLVAQGVVGRDIGVEQARGLAEIAVVNALAAVAAAAGGVGRIVRCLQLTVYISAVAGFTEHTTVADGASAALLAALGDRGVVARAAVGVAGLPGGAPLEVVLTAVVEAAPDHVG